MVIGPRGVNHGIELHADNVEYAMERLSSLRHTSALIISHNSAEASNSSSEAVRSSSESVCEALWERELCEPQFFCGNCLRLAPDTPRYDRVYCGAACPQGKASIFLEKIQAGNYDSIHF